VEVPKKLNSYSRELKQFDQYDNHDLKKSSFSKPIKVELAVRNDMGTHVLRFYAKHPTVHGGSVETIREERPNETEAKLQA
jgi:hypothetical protein